ncbi:hypothetical protein TUBRATIS_007960, partial [Tubulinosema ratisbonensis]
EENNHILDCEQSLINLNINLQEREKNGKNIENILKKEEIKSLKESDLTQLSSEIIEKYSDFILQIIKERNLPIDFYLISLFKEKYILSDYEVKEIIDYLTLRNDFNNLIKLDRLFPVSKLMVLLENNLQIYYKIIIHWLKRYHFYSGNIFNLFTFLKGINDFNSLKILLEFFPNLLSMTPKKKRLQIDKVKEIDFIEASFVEEVFLEEKESITYQESTFTLLSDKTAEEIKCLEEEYYSTDDFLQANTLIIQSLQNNENFSKIKELISNPKVVKELNYKTMLNLHNKLIKERKKENLEILNLLCKNGRQDLILTIYFELLNDNSKIVLKLLKRFNKYVFKLEKEACFVIKQFYEKNNMVSLEMSEVDFVLKDLLKKSV